ncbi:MULTISPECIES: carbohydrate kinase family protein [unclassified Lentimicrobium]|uniref:carbohydrate kinase family protein n=1 Tax=unclassified Lentimicrobium TaxID=2677434 RepID=UPI001555AD1D|nr:MULTISPECIES: carbohydrate kinase family protein [unclassified Lentimicrobium]NPD47812.1 kinase [Lentimicrobium sp. S6]NPD86068.1 kinase [Lentimicrobium sp. L6]
MSETKSSKKKVIVIGAAIADITGFSSKPLIENDSNPGEIKFSSGGVGRNIAENLARLDCHVELITAFGNDVYALGLKSHCQETGIQIDNSLFSSESSTAIYLSINNPDGNMAMAISDTEIIDELSPEFMASKKSIIEDADCIVLDTNLSEETLKYIAENFSQIPIFLDLVSTSKAKKAKSILNYFHTIKPNLIEAEHLSGIKFEEAKDLDLMLKDFVSTGIQQVFISKGEEGCFYGNTEKSGVFRSKISKVVNSSGAGDAFMAGLVFAHLYDYDLEESATFATALSLAALQSEEAVNPQLNLELANHIRQEL